MIRATYMGKSVTVKVEDTCMGCAIGDLDFSPSAFLQLAPFDVGRMRGVTVSLILRLILVCESRADGDSFRLLRNSIQWQWLN